MNSILIFGAGKSATYLIEYLGKTCDENGWRLLVCDADLQLAQSKIDGNKNSKAISIDVSNDDERTSLIQESGIIISMLPPHLHFLVANDCLKYSKHLLTASYIDEKIKALEEKIVEKDLFFLCEMGLDPGIDHMSAMKIIKQIKAEGGKITSFKSHCGGLVAPENDDNPWHYKITWNPANIVMAGSQGAIYRSDREIVKVPYQKIFENCTEVSIPGLFPLAWYPNRDSFTYIDTYGLDDVETFIRTTLRFPSFCRGWDKIVNIGLTALDDYETIKNCRTYAEWFKKKLETSSLIYNEGNQLNNTDQDGEFFVQAEYLGLYSNMPIDASHKSSASIFQHLLETKLAIQPHEKDMIVMLHEIGYKLNGENRMVTSSLVVKGLDQVHTAMAKTVGLPLGIAAKLILDEKIKLRGLHIPIHPEIYEPVLAELEKHSIQFNEEAVF